MCTTFIALLIFSNFFSIVVIIWTTSQPEFREAWQRIKVHLNDVFANNCDDEDIKDSITEFHSITARIKEAETMDDLRGLFYDIQNFEYLYRRKVPEAVFTDFSRRIDIAYQQESDRVIRGGKPAIATK
jgi:hypothetical protein